MEAERMAAEAAPEPDRTAPAPAAPDLVLLQRAPAEYVRRLSRTHGNRRVALALQRQPATAAPPIAKGYKPVSTTDLRWQKVDDLLTWTPLGWEAREVMRKHQVPLAEASVP